MIQRKHIHQDPFIAQNSGKPWRERGLWPCRWLLFPTTSPSVVAYRLAFTLQEAATITIHVTADERYMLYLDGGFVGRGSERGDADNWFYESYELHLAAGTHRLVARVWALGKRRPLGRMSVKPGFLLCAEGELGTKLSTGSAEWYSKTLSGYTFIDFPAAHWRGARADIDGAAFDWSHTIGGGSGWEKAGLGRDGVGKIIDWSMEGTHHLQPTTLLSLLDEVRRIGSVRHIDTVGIDNAASRVVRSTEHISAETDPFNHLLTAIDPAPVTFPAHSTRRLIIDLDDYYCLYPTLTLSGGAGARVRLFSAESLYTHPDPFLDLKGHRDQIEGKYFVGIGNQFHPDGTEMRTFDTLALQVGRYWELIVETGAQPLTLHRLTLRESRYPLEQESTFEASDPRLPALTPMMLRGLQMCSHETYYDAPYYEELMYTGDTRMEMLITYAISRDARLPHKAIRLFDSSRLADGMLQSRYPCWDKQVIAPFSLWWVMMLFDYAFWREPDFVKPYLPGMRATLEGYHRLLNADGLVETPAGWNFMDWYPQWEAGIPPGALDHPNALINFHYAYVLTIAAKLERHLGEPELAALWQRRAQAVVERANIHFWDDARALFCEGDGARTFTEHTQVMALLSGLLTPARHQLVAEQLITDPDLKRTTYYFTHYLFEVYHLLRRGDLLQERMADWYAMADLGLRTPLERPEPSRSDCHAWSSHPLFHYFSTILGIRPTALGFRQVAIRPNLGTLTWAKGTLVHPLGEIHADFSVENDSFSAEITLPQGVTGTLHVHNHQIPLPPGHSSHHIPIADQLTIYQFDNLTI